MKRLIAGLVVLLLLAAGAAFAFRGPLSLAVMDQTIRRSMTADLVAGLPDGLHAFVCGSGSPLPDPQRTGPCLAVIAGDRVFLVDAGEGAAETLARGALPAARIEQVFLSHFHSDHIDGLSAVALQHWVGRAATTPLMLTGPQGVERIASGLNELYAIDNGYRTAHHGAAVAPPSGAGFVARRFEMPQGPSQVTVLDDRGLRVTAFRVAHGPVEPAVGYRFDYKGRSLVVSGDTAVSANLVRVAKGADLMIHDALSPALVRRLKTASLAAGRKNQGKILEDIINYHASPEQIADQASSAGVSALLMTHIVPPLPLKALEGPFLGQAQDRFKGPLWIARDRDLISLPAGGKAITRTRVGR